MRKTKRALRVTGGRRESQRLVNQGVGEFHVGIGLAVTGWKVKVVNRSRMRIRVRIQVLKKVALVVFR